MPNLRRTPALLVLLAVLLPVVLQAQPAPPPSQPSDAPPPPPPPAEAPPSQADSLSDQGKQLYRDRQYAQAFKLFEAAFAIEPRPAFLYNMAKCKEKLAEYDRAVELYERYLQVYRKQNSGQDPPDEIDVANLIRTLKQRAFEALPEVAIQSSPPGAQVLLDGKVTLGSTPLTTHLKPGKYRIVLKLPQHVDLDTEVVVPETGRVALVLSLKSIVRRAGLTFWCNVRGAQIAVDGKVVAVTPFSGRAEIEPGRHQITLTRAGYDSVEREVQVPEDKELHLRVVMQRRDSVSSWRTYLGWPLMILGGGGVAGGVVASRFADDYYAGSPQFNKLEEYQNLGYVGGGSAIGLGLLLTIWDGVREEIPAEERVEGATFESGEVLRPLGPAPSDKGTP